MQDLPHGFKNILGEWGVRFSGSQRLLMGIAKALYYDPEIHIFDEAFSVLNLTEQATMDAIHN